MEYLEFSPQITDKSQIKSIIEQDAGVLAQEQNLYSAYENWWILHSPTLAKLPETKAEMTLRQEFISSFVLVLEAIGLLNRFKIVGVMATWWEDVRYELRTLTESGFVGLVDSWVETVKDALENDEENDSKTKFNPLEHKLVIRLLADYLEEIAQVESQIGDLEQQKENFERGEDEGEEENEEESVNLAKQLENRLKELKNLIKDEQKQLKDLKKKSSLLEQIEIERLKVKILPVEAEIEEIEAQLKPYNEIKQKLNEAKQKLGKLKQQLITRLETARKSLSVDECQKLVLTIFEEGIRIELERSVNAHRQEVIKTVETWWDKYKVTLREIEQERDEAAKRLDSFLKKLGYK